MIRKALANAWRAQETLDRTAVARARRPRPLTQTQLDELRAQLEARRRELMAGMMDLDSELSEGQFNDGTSDELECAGERAEAELLGELLQEGWAKLREIDEALARMEGGTYGVCLATG